MRSKPFPRVLCAFSVIILTLFLIACAGQVSQRPRASGTSTPTSAISSESVAPTSTDRRPSVDELHKATREQIAEGRRYLKRKYAELNGFKDTPSFREYAFSQKGPHYSWLEDLQEHRDKNYGWDVGVALADLLSLGLEYMSTKQSQTLITRARQNIETVIAGGKTK